MKSLGSQGCKRWLPACTNCVESESCLGAFGQRGRLAHRMCFPSFNEIRIRQYVSHMKCVCVCVHVSSLRFIFVCGCYTLKIASNVLWHRGPSIASKGSWGPECGLEQGPSTKMSHWNAPWNRSDMKPAPQGLSIYEACSKTETENIINTPGGRKRYTLYLLSKYTWSYNNLWV
jgi:hypothetical protein